MVQTRANYVCIALSARRNWHLAPSFTANCGPRKILVFNITIYCLFLRKSLWEAMKNHSWVSIPKNHLISNCIFKNHNYIWGIFLDDWSTNKFAKNLTDTCKWHNNFVRPKALKGRYTQISIFLKIIYFTKTSMRNYF